MLLLMTMSHPQVVFLPPAPIHPHIYRWLESGIVHVMGIGRPGVWGMQIIHGAWAYLCAVLLHDQSPVQVQKPQDCFFCAFSRTVATATSATRSNGHICLDILYDSANGGWSPALTINRVGAEACLASAFFRSKARD